MQNNPKPQEIYRHFKGHLCQIITIATHSETGEQMVVYQALYGNFKIYTRPLAKFFEKTDRRRYPDAGQECRFVRVEREAANLSAAAAPPEGKALKSPADSETDKQSGGSAADAVLFENKNMPQEISPGAPAVETEPEPAEYNMEEFPQVDPMVMKFLNADSYEARLQILSGLHHRLTDSMVNTIAASLDIEIADGELERRYEELHHCLLTMRRFESRR